LSAQNSPNPGSPGRRGWKRALYPLRRLLHRALRSVLLRLDAIEARANAHEVQLDAAQREATSLHARVDDVADRIEGTVTLAWDYAATVRRLATLEDRVEALMRQAESSYGSDAKSA
jgi:hypothetical protein